MIKKRCLVDECNQKRAWCRAGLKLLHSSNALNNLISRGTISIRGRSLLHRAQWAYVSKEPVVAKSEVFLRFVLDINRVEGREKAVRV